VDWLLVLSDWDDNKADGARRIQADDKRKESAKGWYRTKGAEWTIIMVLKKRKRRKDRMRLLNGWDGESRIGKGGEGGWVNGADADEEGRERARVWVWVGSAGKGWMGKDGQRWASGRVAIRGGPTFYRCARCDWPAGGDGGVDCAPC
jgi:hypothetical protein